MVSKKVIVISPTLGITTPIVVVTGEVIVVAMVLVAVPVDTAVLPCVPLIEKKLWNVVGPALVKLDSKVVVYVETVVNATVLVVVNTEVSTTVFGGAVTLLVKVETETDTGTIFAPLGRLIDEVLETGGVVEGFDGESVVGTLALAPLAVEGPGRDSVVVSSTFWILYPLPPLVGEEVSGSVVSGASF